MGPAAEPSRFRDQKGNLITFEQVYDTYFEAVFRYILHRVANVAEAEDLTSQTFFKALKGRWKFRWTGVPVSAWLYRIASNEVNAHMRGGGGRNNANLDRLSPSLVSPDGQADRELLDAERELAQHGVFLALNSSLRGLKPKQQTLIVLRYFEQKTFAEMAQILGKREGAVTMATHRALQKLKDHMEKQGFDHEKISRSFEESPQTEYSSGSISAKFAS